MADLLVVSPHLDDAVLSVGATLARYAARGHRPVVYTVFAGTPKPPYSPVAEGFHRQWSITGDPLEVRRSEDRAALRTLGATPLHGRFTDAIYRRDDTGRWLVDVGSGPVRRQLPDEATLVTAVVAAIVAQIRRIEPELVMTCAAIGGHVDHVRARDAAVRAARSTGVPVQLWEDLPYGLWSRRSAPLPAGLSRGAETGSEVFDAQIWRTKAAAVGCYASQLPMLSAQHASVTDLLERHALRRAEERAMTGHHEVLWWVDDPGGRP